MIFIRFVLDSYSIRTSPVKAALYLPVKRHRDQHNAKDNDGKQRDRYNKNNSRLRTYDKCHDNASEYNKRGSQEESQEQIQSALHLVDITRHSRDQCGSTQLVHLRKSKGLDM